MKISVMLAAVVASTLALSGCGGDDTQTTTTTAAPPAATTETTTTTDTMPAETTSTETTPPAPKPKTIAIVVENGRPQGGIQRPKIDKGTKIVLVVDSDAGEEVHVHGYDIERELTPGTPLRIPITANIPGRFEVELHHPDVLLAVLEVQP